jgi:cytochrome b subunit of formate dehydrogenase
MTLLQDGQSARSPLAAVAMLLVLSLVPSAWAQTAPPDNRECLNCHGKPEMASLAPEDRWRMLAPVAGEEAALAEAPATRPGIHIGPADYIGVHAELRCVDCHADVTSLLHGRDLEPAQCQSCHAVPFDEHASSVHGQALEAGQGKAAHCYDCHGTHDILTSGNPQSRTYKLNLPFTCAVCHSNTNLMAEAGVRHPLAAEQYIDSMHGRGLIKQGLIVVPSCSDCHGVHAIYPDDDVRSSIHKDEIPDTCGTCHAGIEAIYREGVHGQLWEAGDDRGPVCSSCHTSHEIIDPTDTAFKLQIDDRCGRCHEDRLRFYRETFHGKAMALGMPGVAACFDCHGAHGILPTHNPDSMLSEQHRLETCQKCHPKATAGFTEYIAHAHHSDREHHPVLFWTFVLMTSIVVGTFTFFGVHTLLWLVRSFMLYARNPAAFRAAKIKAAKDDEVFVRFRPFERFLHGLVVVSFLLLVATGMPLKFYYTGWAQVLVDFMGGLEVAGYLHRVGAVVTFIYFALHLGSLGKAAIRARERYKDPKSGRFSIRRFFGVVFGPDMPLPNLQDVRDFWAHQKWFFGKGPQPQFDKWTYWEKFDYFAVFWGVLMIGISGMVMWFPEAFTRVIPGWCINVALIIHSDEALLAAGFIFTFHFFNVHFRIEKFPMDPVIFSGRMSKTEMLHERRRWYDRLVANDCLDAVRVRDDWSQWKRVMHPIGFLAFGIGTLLLVLIFYAMGARLFGFG